MSEIRSNYSEVHFVCPVCKTKVAFAESSFFCSRCNKYWPLHNDIADFRVDNVKYWGEYPQDTMKNLILRAQITGWEQALKELFLEKDPSYYEYILDESRAHWHFLIPLKKEARILDLGCGWGTLSFALAKQYGEVFAFDITQERLEFITLKKMSENTANLFPVCGKISALPFPDGHFDLVILNGVLEWIPSLEEEGKPYAVQLGALREARRVLKGNGSLYLAIENRWSLINFLGFKDTHSGLRFAPLLPRPVADVYSRLARRKRFREYTYTYWEHKRMLKDAGFSDIKFYAPLPSYRSFAYIIPLDDYLKIKFFIRRLAFARNYLQQFLISVVKLLYLFRFIKYFVPDFSIVAKKYE